MKPLKKLMRQIAPGIYRGHSQTPVPKEQQDAEDAKQLRDAEQIRQNLERNAGKSFR